MFPFDGRNAAKYLLVRQFVLKRVDLYGHVSRPPRTIVEIQIALRHKIHIVKYETLPVCILERLLEADVEKNGPVEVLDRHVLFDDVN